MNPSRFPVPRGMFGPHKLTPFGGPSSGLWPRGASGQAAPGPAPAPAPACTAADIFADCFAAAVGVINSGSPGPVAGWTYNEVFGPKGGQITFTPGQMQFQMLANNNQPGATSPITLADITNMTVQALFTEFTGPTGLGTSSYNFYILSAGGTNIFQVQLSDDGVAFVALGPSINASQYFGTWTPNNGTHTVHLTVDNAGVPTLSIDGVDIPLTFVFAGPNVIGFPANSVAVFFLAGLSSPDNAELTKLFIASGQLPADTVFCCP